MQKYFFFLIILGFSSSVIASNICENTFDKEVMAISKSMIERNDQSRWQKYGEFLNKYADCLDGSYAETVQGISEDALANDWNGFISFVEKSKPVKKVLINIESGFSPEMGLVTNLKKIKENSKQLCPPIVKSFCDKVSKAKL